MNNQVFLSLALLASIGTAGAMQQQPKITATIVNKPATGQITISISKPASSALRTPVMPQVAAAAVAVAKAAPQPAATCFTCVKRSTDVKPGGQTFTCQSKCGNGTYILKPRTGESKCGTATYILKPRTGESRCGKSNYVMKK